MGHVSLRKLLGIFTLVLLLLALTSCGDSSSNNGGNNTGGNTGGIGGNGSGGGDNGGGGGNGGGSGSTARSFLYFFTIDDPTIAGFRIDPSTGALTSVGSAPAPVHAQGEGPFRYNSIAGSNSTPYFHVVTYPGDSYSGPDYLDTFTIDTATGIPSGSSSIEAHWGHLATNANGALLFLAHSTDAGADVVSYSLTSSGTPTEVSRVSFSGYPLDLESNSTGDLLYTGPGGVPGDATQHILQFSVDSAGQLQQRADAVSPSFQQLVSTGSYVYSRYGSAEGTVNGFAASPGSMTPLSGSPFTVAKEDAISPGAFESDPGGNFLVAVTEHSVSVHRLDNGVPTQTDSRNDLTAGFDRYVGGITFATLVESTYVYVTADSGIYGYKLNTDGTLALISGAPFPTPETLGDGVFKQFQ